MTDTETTRQRSALWYREYANRYDVADALANILRRDPYVNRFAATKDVPPQRGLPKGITIEEVATELVEISLVNPDTGKISPSPAAAKKKLYEHHLETLRSGVTFSFGYDHYANETNQQVVPVTHTFFKHVYKDGENRDALEAMTDAEIMYSLPRRESKPLRDQAGVFYTRKEAIQLASEAKEFDTQVVKFSDEVDVSGKVVGVMVFPAGYPKISLIVAWLQRSMNRAKGTFDSAMNRIERAVRDGYEQEHVSDLRGEGFEAMENIERTLHRKDRRIEPRLLTKE